MPESKDPEIKHICTYFDINFLPRGLALYNSIKRFHNNFVFYVLAFDQETIDYLMNLKIENLEIISAEVYNSYFNTNKDRYEDRKQYYFSSTPNLCLYIFDKFRHIEMLLYLDADVYVFNSLESLYEEVGAASIAFCSHRFYPLFDLLSNNYGRYNVGVNFFRRTDTGMKCLKEWKYNCESWYPDKPGYSLNFFSDQIFLDDWCSRYDDVCVIGNIGVNTAPWNIANYRVKLKDEGFYINDKPLLIYHFSSLKKVSEIEWNGNTIFFFGSIKGNLLKVYKMYISEIESFGLSNLKIVTITHKNSFLKRIFYFFMRLILNEKIIIKTN